ncbi:cytidylate kinase-like family protein [Lachnospiraceae bacterium MD335]|nr:cytidylate kinase-like family protein [Lachnospiraceae bacterium MD335]
MFMYRYVAIERQFCSGGQEVASILAKKLGYKLYDHDILVETANRLELPAIYVSDLEETSSTNPIFNLSQTALGGLSKKKNIPLSEQIFQAEKQVILDVAENESCVFVGRCAGHILSEKEDCLRVFIYADDAFRLERARTKEKIPMEKVEAEMKRVDKRRSGFFTNHTDCKWGAQEFFQISLNSATLGIETCAEILAAAVKNH